MEQTDKSMGDGLRTALGNGPAHRMTSPSQKHAERRTERRFQLENGVRRDTGKQSARPFALKQTLRQSRGRLHGANAEACQQKRMARNRRHGTKRVIHQLLPMLDKRAVKLAVGRSIRAQLFCRKRQVFFEHYRRAVI